MSYQSIVLTFGVALRLAIAAGGTPTTVRVSEEITVNGTVTSVTGNLSGDAANAVVWLKPNAGAPERQLARRPAQRLKIVQRDKKFDPHLLVVQVGAVVDFPNLDPWFHNVFSLYDGKRFDLGLYEAGSSRNVTFSRPGVCYVFCNIHPEMSALVVAVDTPYYGTTAKSGEFAIQDVPAGRYQLFVWHERYQPERPADFPREVTVSKASHTIAPIRLVAAKDLIVGHKNKYGQDYNPPPSGALYKK